MPLLYTLNHCLTKLFLPLLFPFFTLLLAHRLQQLSLWVIKMEEKHSLLYFFLIWTFKLPQQYDKVFKNRCFLYSQQDFYLHTHTYTVEWKNLMKNWHVCRTIKSYIYTQTRETLNTKVQILICKNSNSAFWILTASSQYDFIQSLFVHV